MALLKKCGYKFIILLLLQLLLLVKNPLIQNVQMWWVHKIQDNISTTFTNLQLLQNSFQI